MDGNIPASPLPCCPCFAGFLRPFVKHVRALDGGVHLPAPFLRVKDSKDRTLRCLWADGVPHGYKPTHVIRLKSSRISAALTSVLILFGREEYAVTHSAPT